MKKMSKRPRTRRQKALMTAAAILPLLLLWGLLNRYGLTLDSAIRGSEDIEGIDRTRLVRELGSQWSGESKGTFTLSAGDGVLLLSRAEFSLTRGWQDRGSTVLDCSTGEPVKAGLWGIAPGREEEGNLWAYGRVDDARVERLTISARDEKGGIPEGGEFILERKDFFAWPEYACFTASIPWSGQWMEAPPQYWLTAYDAAGAIVYENLVAACEYSYIN